MTTLPFLARFNLRIHRFLNRATWRQRTSRSYLTYTLFKFQNKFKAFRSSLSVFGRLAGFGVFWRYLSGLATGCTRPGLFYTTSYYSIFATRIIKQQIVSISKITNSYKYFSDIMITPSSRIKKKRNLNIKRR